MQRRIRYKRATPRSRNSEQEDPDVEEEQQQQQQQQRQTAEEVHATITAGFGPSARTFLDQEGPDPPRAPGAVRVAGIYPGYASSEDLEDDETADVVPHEPHEHHDVVATAYRVEEHDAEQALREELERNADRERELDERVTRLERERNAERDRELDERQRRLEEQSVQKKKRSRLYAGLAITLLVVGGAVTAAAFIVAMPRGGAGDLVVPTPALSENRTTDDTHRPSLRPSPEPTEMPPLVFQSTAALYEAVDLYLDDSGGMPPIESWDVSRVTNMHELFSIDRNPDAEKFDSGLASWDVSRVTDMSRMFKGAKAFNQDLSRWKVSKVTNMERMFYWAFAFNQNISSWDLSGVKSTVFMFWGAGRFNQNLCAWGPALKESKAETKAMFEHTGCTSDTPPALDINPLGDLCHPCDQTSPDPCDDYTSSLDCGRTSSLDFDSGFDCDNLRGLKREGVAHCVAEGGKSFLRLTRTTYEAGTYYTPLLLPQVFSWEVEYRIYNSIRKRHADGIALVIHQDPRGTGALGGKGDHLGVYGGGGAHPNIKNALVIELDTSWNKNVLGLDDSEAYNIHVRSVDASGAARKLGQAAVGGDRMLTEPSGSGSGRVWVDSCGDGSLEVFLNSTGNSKPAIPDISVGVDVAALFDGQNVFLGFAASTGGYADYHDILSFSFHDSCSNL